MFEPEVYLRLLNTEYVDSLQQLVSLHDLHSQAPRILQKLDEYFRRFPLKRGQFSHYRPTRYFSENVGQLEKFISPQTKDRFEPVFDMLNQLL